MSREFRDLDCTIPEQDSKVGIIVVHGIGQQRRFEHLKMVVKNITDVFRSDKKIEVEVVSRSEEYDDPAIILIRNQDGDITGLHFHEVWWADIAPKTSLQSNLSFWAWASSLWSKNRHLRGSLADIYQDKMSYPGSIDLSDAEKINRKIPCYARMRIFFTSWVFILVVPLVAALNNVVLPIFRVRIPLDIIPAFMGKVKLFTQEKSEASYLSLEDIDYPPRIAIRKRMIQELVRVAEKKYDRWYILAHSLGSVIAFNSLMESEEILPNYVDFDLWCKIKENSFTTKTQAGNSKGEKISGVTRPRRPFWIGEDEFISRRKLFENLRGFMTYGSPLSKFAVMWPGTIYINNDERVFNQFFEWINVYDPTDTIAGPVTSEFSPSSNSSKEDLCKPLMPKDIVNEPSTSIFRFHLLSHLTYMRYTKGKKWNGPTKECLIESVANWILSGDQYTPPENNRKNEQRWIVLREFIWVCLSIVLLILIAIFIPTFINQTLSVFAWIIYQATFRFLDVTDILFLKPVEVKGVFLFFCNFLWMIFLFSIAFVSISGVARYCFDCYKASIFNVRSVEKEIEFYLDQNRERYHKYDDILDKFKYFYSELAINKALSNLSSRAVIAEQTDDENNSIYCFSVNQSEYHN